MCGLGSILQVKTMPIFQQVDVDCMTSLWLDGVVRCHTFVTPRPNATPLDTKKCFGRILACVRFM